MVIAKETMNEQSGISGQLVAADAQALKAIDNVLQYRLGSHDAWREELEEARSHIAIRLQPVAVAGDESAAYEAWFLTQQGTAYDGAWSFARAAWIHRAALTALSAAPFQSRVAPWMQECFGAVIANDVRERGDRLLEEVLELLQSHGYDQARVATLRDYVFGRPVGEPQQEVGGVMVTLAAYCLATGVDMHAAGDTELARISAPEVVERIRLKQASKRGLHTPLPVPPRAPSEQMVASVEADLDFEPDEHHTVADMANVGYSLMQAIKSNCPEYCWNETPAEIVGDLMNERDEALGVVPGRAEVAASVAVPDYETITRAMESALADLEAKAAGTLSRKARAQWLGTQFLRNIAAAPVAPEREVGRG